MVIAYSCVTGFLLIHWIYSGHLSLSILYESSMFLSWSFSLIHIILEVRSPIFLVRIASCAAHELRLTCCWLCTETADFFYYVKSIAFLYFDCYGFAENKCLFYCLLRHLVQANAKWRLGLQKGGFIPAASDTATTSASKEFSCCAATGMCLRYNLTLP
ncbi:unnamed protein product [Sphagnum troendelagicum]|uniref:Uncharacterized protein n=1 Tax=Sphagnum troendelagicum TaxID=128251 RepID=A0ABP0V136_9BRYO